MREQLPTGPFIDWLKQRVRRYEAAGEANPNARLAADLGVNVRTLSRWQRGYTASSRNGVEGDYPTDSFSRAMVEEALNAVAASFEEVYPDFASAVVLEEDAYCPTCREMVTPIEWCCPWCDTAVSEKRPQRAYCEACDRQVWAPGDTCWRCGGDVRFDMPYVQCACGCGTEIPKFDLKGRRPRWARGHQPRSEERIGKELVDAEPFRRFLEHQVKTVDPIQAVASRFGISREELVAVLAGEEEQVERGRVTRAMWVAGRYGQGTGMPKRADIPSFFDLYPNEARARVCPSCGQGKAPHAELCKACRRKKASRERRAGRQNEVAIPPAVYEEAKRQRAELLLSVSAIARRLHPQTQHKSVDTCRIALLVLFKRDGIDTSYVSAADRVDDVLLTSARRLRENVGLSFDEIGERLVRHTPRFDDPAQLTAALRAAFKKRGWQTGRVRSGPRSRQAIAA